MKNSPHNLPAIVSVISQKMKMSKLTTAVLTASVVSIAAISSGCSQPEPIEQNAPKYGLVTADDANEDTQMWQKKLMAMQAMSEP